MSHYTDLERMRGTVEDLSLKKQLPRRQHTDKPILKYDTSITKPVQLFNQGDALAHHEGYSPAGVAGAPSSFVAQNGATHGAVAANPIFVRNGSGGSIPSSPANGVNNPYSRPLSAKEVIEDVQQNHRNGWHHHQVTSCGHQSLPTHKSYNGLPTQQELDTNARAEALQHNPFLRPQSGAVGDLIHSNSSPKKGKRTGSGVGDGPETRPKFTAVKQYAPEESQGYRVTSKGTPSYEESAKASLQHAFALAATTNASHTALTGLPPRPKNGHHREPPQIISNSSVSTSAMVRNSNYTSNRQYSDVNETIGGSANSINAYSNSAVTSEQSMFNNKQSLTNYHVVKPLNSPSHSSRSTHSSLDNHKARLTRLMNNGRMEPLPRSPTGLGAMAGIEESGLPLHNLTASSLLNTKMGLLRKMPVTNTLTGTLYYKKSFREAGKEVEQKIKLHPSVLEQRPRGDGAPSRQVRVPGEEKGSVTAGDDDAEEEDDDDVSTPSGERLPGDGEASIEDLDDDDDGIDDLYDDDDQAEDDDSDDYTICSNMSQASASTVRLRSAASRPSTTQSARSRTTLGGDERSRSFVRPLTSSGETVVQPALRRSLFSTIPPTINFISEGEKVEQLPWEIRKLLKWRMSPITPNIVKSALGRSNFRITKKNNDWLGCFGKHMKANGFRSLREYQKLNHFPGSFQLGRKDRLWRNLSKMQVSFGKKEFGFFPQTYVLPQDLKQLKRTWEDTNARQKWIIKPPASARGIGIKVIHKWNQIPRKKPVIVQKYLGKPLLINGSKFDMRVYVYVSSYDPLRAYVFEDGLARFASCKYSSSMKNLNNKFMHLTNYSINKRNSEYQSNTDDSVCQGHKWSLKSLWNYLKKEGVNTQAVWDSIKDIVVKTLISAEGPINSMVKSNCRSRYIVHELFGFDILLDEQLRPWILEVNISPSLHSNSQLDINVKGQMIRDMMNIAGFRVPDKNDIIHGAHSASVAQDLSAHIPSSDYCMDKRLFTNQVSADERAKHAHFCHKHQDEQVLQCILDILTPDDVRILTESIDEDSRKGGFIRVFPTPSTKKYLRYFEQPRYYNLLLDQWVLRYNRMEQRGISLLQSLCEEGLHLENPTENPRHQWCPPNSVAMLSARDKTSSTSLKKEGVPVKQSPSVARLPKVRSGVPVTQSSSNISVASGASSYSGLNTSPTAPPRSNRPLDPSR